MKAEFKCYYDRAPEDTTFPYGVFGDISAANLNSGELSTFDVDVWTDDKLPSATEDLEALCDELRNFLHERVIAREGVFLGRILYERREPPDERERDLSHRRLSFAARLFFYN